MSQDVINEHTDEKIKDYLSEENIGNSEQLKNADFGEVDGKKKYKSKKVVFAILFLIIVIFLSLSYYMRLKGKQSFDDENVKISIEVPSDITSGKEEFFDIKYENKTNVALSGVKISLFVPKEFLFISSDSKEEAKKEETVITWNLTKISAGEMGSIKVRGKIIGEKDKEYNLNSKISYTPENFNYEFESSDSLSRATAKIMFVPFELLIQAPEEIINGSEIEFTINYKNISKREFDLINIKAQLPSEFEYKSSIPEIIEKKEDSLSWNIENIEPNSDGKLVVKGNINAGEDKEKEIKATLNASEKNSRMLEYVNKSISVAIIEIPINIKQMVNGQEEYSTIKGEELEYKIKFKNQGEENIKGLVINSKIEGLVDFNSLDVINGSYNKEDNKIVWSAFNVPKLALLEVGEEGEVSFKIKVNEYIEVKKADDKNFTINNKVTISSFNFDSGSVSVEKIIASNENIVKLKSSLFVKAKGYFNDDGRIKNKGVIPPEVDKETTYLIHWNLNSLLGDIDNISIVTTLPEGVKWTGNYIKSDGKVSLGDETNGAFTPEEKNDSGDLVIEDISIALEVENNKEEGEEVDENKIKEENFFYNTKSREVVWELPLLEANTGIISPAKEVVFQVSIRPTESDIGKILTIMNEVKATSNDKFTNEEINTYESELTTELPDDYSIGIEEGIVVENSEN
ncbi:MAG: hypothetical protein P1P85_03620 [Patescibacteria group bacterium]|nr:hypothetical protein [Patescibacteria group bacterium]